MKRLLKATGRVLYAPIKVARDFEKAIAPHPLHMREVYNARRRRMRIEVVKLCAMGIVFGNLVWVLIGAAAGFYGYGPADFVAGCATGAALVKMAEQMEGFIG